MHHDLTRRELACARRSALTLVLCAAASARGAGIRRPPNAPPPQAAAGAVPACRRRRGDRRDRALHRPVDHQCGCRACKGAGETLGGATSAAGDLAKGVTDAAGTVARLPLSNVVAGHRSGAPSRRTARRIALSASVALCKAKGFAARQLPRHHVVAQVPRAGLAARGAADRRRVRQRVVRLARDVPVVTPPQAARSCGRAHSVTSLSFSAALVPADHCANSGHRPCPRRDPGCDADRQGNAP